MYTGSRLGLLQGGALSCFVLLSACSGDDKEKTEAEVQGDDRYCSLILRIPEPVLIIDGVTDVQGNAISEVSLSNVTLSGGGVDEPAPWYLINVDFDNDTQVYQCTLPCALFDTEGSYSFDVSAEGYVDKTVSIDATYENYFPDCGGWHTGGEIVNVMLDRVDTGSARTLDSIGSDKVQVTVVDSYFSLYTYGPTQHFYVFESQKAVLSLYGNDSDLSVSATVTLFSENETVEGIERWVNNLHSDGLYPEVAEPLANYTVDGSAITISNLALLGRTVGNAMEEYDDYSMTVSLDSIVEAGAFTLEGFNVDFIIHQLVVDPLDVR